jgi:hypothetical protein
MALKPEHSFSATLAVMALDYGIYQLSVPSIADVRGADPHNSWVDGGRKAATWTAISACAALSLLAKDANIFIFGGGFAVALDFWYRHANAMHPGTGQVTLPPAAGTAPGGVSAATGS